MNKKLLLSLVLFLYVSIGFSQNLWTKTSQSKLEGKEKVHRSSTPKEPLIYKLNLASLESKLKMAPMRGDIIPSKSPVRISFPNANGQFENFAIVETPAMEETLAMKMPMIKAYAGQGIEDPSATIRFTVTQFGLHTMTLSGTKRSWYIDPFTKDRENYIVYSKDNLGADVQEFECLTDQEVDLPSVSGISNRATNDDLLRTFRLAQSCTGEYGAIFGLGTGTIAEQKARVQAQMVITMTRVNGIYERDLAVTMIFVANNDLVIYLDGGTDPWGNEWNTQTAVTLDGVIGVNNYDIGHNFNTTGGGNAGCLFCVCTSASQTGTHKGRGYTGRADPTGDPFDVDYVAHEMGHQFGGYHTMNSCSRSGGTYVDGIGSEVEPASGSTIMAYAGICASNVQSNSDAYFNFVNLEDISENLLNGASNSCAVETNIGNAAPTAAAGIDFIIPISTPYALTGISTDANGTDSHTFTWEQIDNEQRTQEAPQTTYPNGPLTRSIEGTTNRTRYIPNLPDLIAGTTTWEVLASVNRDINFALTVRDNFAAGGQTAVDLKKLTTTTTAGPFLVTSQNTATTWPQGSTETITWNVAGTTGNGVNAANVDIILFKNGDFDTPIILAAGVPNNGSANIVVPNGEAPNCKIIVKGANHVFFNINGGVIEIAGAVNPVVSYVSSFATATEGSDCNFSDITVPLSIAIGASADTTVNFVVNNGTTTATEGFDFDLITASVQFLANTTDPQDMIFRIYHDSFDEINENLTIDFTVDANGGDAVASNNSYSYTITNDDQGMPSTTQVVNIFDSNFETTDTTAWSVLDNNGDARNWVCCFSGAQFSGVTGLFAASESKGQLLPATGGNNIKPDNLFYNTTAITIPITATNVNFTYDIAGYQDSEPFEVYWTLDASNFANITGGILLDSGNTLTDSGELRSIDVTTLAGQSGFIVFRHVSTGNGVNGTSGLLLLDNVNVNVTVPSFIQTAINTGSTNDQANIKGAGIVYTNDSVSGDVMLDMTNNTTFDFGCTDISVSRSGTSAQPYNGIVAPNLAMDKVFTLTPSAVTSTGSTTVKFYFELSEIQGWEAATGLSRTALVIYRENGNEIITPSIGAFGSNVTLIGNFTGLNGDFYFGTTITFATVLGTTDVDLIENQFSLYPNPTSNTFLIAGLTSKAIVSVYSVNGKKIMSLGEYDSESINVSKLASGLYFVSIESENSKEVKRLIIE